MEQSGRKYKSWHIYYEEGERIHRMLQLHHLGAEISDFVYFVVSNHWFSSWKQKVAFHMWESSQTPSPVDIDCRQILPILNEDIVISEFEGSDWKFIKFSPKHTEKYVGSNVVLKKGIKRNNDYIAVHGEVWATIKHYYPNAIDVPRTLYAGSTPFSVMIYETALPLVQVRFIPQAMMRYANCSVPGKFEVPLFKLQISRRMNVGELRHAILDAAEAHVQEKYLPHNFSHKCLNLILLQQGKTWEDVHKILKKNYPSQYYTCSESIELPGVAISNPTDLLSQYQFNEEGSVLLVEISTPRQFKLQGKPDLGFKGENNLGEIQKYHNQLKYTPGKVGFKNLGNTCYMNATLQCLLKTPEVRLYFEEDYFKTALQETKRVSGVPFISEAFSELVKLVWKPTDTVLEPWILRSLVVRKNKHLDNYSEHDSQEFLSAMINALNEELNLVQDQKAVDHQNHRNSAGIDLKHDSWSDLMRREYSILTHLFQGTMHNEVCCDGCGLRSLSSEPFQLLEVDVLVEKYMQLLFYFVPEEHQVKADNYTMDVSWNPRDPKTNTIRFFLDEFAKFKRVPPHRLKMALLGFKTHGMLLDDNSTLDELLEYISDKNNLLKLFVLQLSEVEAIIAQRPDAIAFITKTVYKDKPLTFSKVTFALPDDKPMALYERVFKKFAHFYKSQFEEAFQDWPAKRVDYEKFFFDRVVGVQHTQRDFKLLLDDEVIDVLDTNLTVGHIYDSYNKRLKERDASEQSSNSVFKKRPTTVLSDIKFTDEALQGIDLAMTLKTTSHHEQVSIRSEIKPSIIQALEDHFSEEALPEDEKVDCTKCKKRTVSSKKLCLEKLPKYLIIHMKKQKLRAFDANTKYLTNIEFPTEGLDLSGFLRDKSKPLTSEYGINKKELQLPHEDLLRVDHFLDIFHEEPKRNEYLYDLYGVVNHTGGQMSGHYTAYVRMDMNPDEDTEWVNFNDSYLNSISADEVVSDAAYLLFYKLRDRPLQ